MNRILQARNGGFTLVELLVAVLVLAIVVGMAAPAVSRLRQNTTIKTVSNTFASDLTWMRSKVTGLGNPITMCPSTDGATCGGTWNSGRIIFSDLNGDGSVTAGKDTVLQVRTAAGSTNNITVTGFGGSGTYIQYKADGSTAAGGTILYCDSSHSGTYGIKQTVLASGEPHTDTSASCP